MKEPLSRYTVILPALCWSRHRPDFYAVTDGVSAGGIHFRSATKPHLAETLTLSIRGIGLVEARVVETGTPAEASAFTVKLRVGRERSIAVARSLVDYARRQQPSTPMRASPRVVPRCTSVPVALEDGTTVPGRLLNVSATGAALVLGHLPRIGAGIRIGKTAATVVRRFEGGIGVTFALPLDPARVDEAVTL